MSKQIGHSNPVSLTFLAACWAAALLIAAVIGWRWVRPANASAWNALPLAAVLALTAFIAFRQQSRTRARRRLQAALDVYAQREIRQGGLLIRRTAENPASAG